MELISNPFIEFAAILIIAAVIGLLGQVLKQPLVVAFIGVGILVGPFGFNLLQSIDQVHLLSELGIAILLFAVGLKLDLTLIRSTGSVALLTGLGQVFFTSFFGYFIAISLGYTPIISIYVAVALTFSSTIIIVKLLSDKKEIDSLHGQISIGFLIVQDMVVILAMIFLSALGTDTASNPYLQISLVIVRGIGMLVFIGLMMRFVLPRLVKIMAHSQELLVLFAISWALALSALGEYLGFSKEVGAFLAGISLASSEYREMISAKMTTLRDFLLLFFFVNLGANLDLSLVSSQIKPAITLSVFVLIGNPLIVLIIMGLMGYRKRTSFLSGLAVAQISEFSLILASMGLVMGHIDDKAMGLITLVGMITIGISTYMIIYSHQIFSFLSPVLSIFEKTNPYREAKESHSKYVRVDVIIFGLGRYGNSIAKSLEQVGRTVMGVDFDPKVVDNWKKMGRLAQMGDADDPDLHELLPLEKARLVISTITDYQINQYLVKTLRENGFKGRIAVTMHHAARSTDLESAGADIILYPFADAVENIVEKLEC